MKNKLYLVTWRSLDFFNRERETLIYAISPDRASDKVAHTEWYLASDRIMIVSVSQVHE